MTPARAVVVVLGWTEHRQASTGLTACKERAKKESDRSLGLPNKEHKEWALAAVRLFLPLNVIVEFFLSV